MMRGRGRADDAYSNESVQRRNGSSHTSHAPIT
ncbi:MAG: hypothetical protein RL383_843, partial [Actinomycetota bacterium]